MIDHRVRGIAAAQRGPLPTRLLTRLASLRARRAALQPITRRRREEFVEFRPNRRSSSTIRACNSSITTSRPASNPRSCSTVGAGSSTGQAGQQRTPESSRHAGPPAPPVTSEAQWIPEHSHGTSSVSQRGGGLQMPTNGVRVCDCRVGTYCAGCPGQAASIRMRAESEL